MGFIALAAIGLATAALLWRLGIARPLWSFVGAGLMLGAAGYAWQGRPLLPGRPTTADTAPIEVDPGLIRLREQMFGRFTGDGAWLAWSDAMLRSGDSAAAAQVILGGIRKVPDSALLWMGLGDVLAIHDAGTMSPPALFAFQRAERLAPQHPGPPFFAGLAYIRGGQFAEALPLWRRALVLTPPDAPYRRDIAVRFTLLQRLLAADPNIGTPQP